jgi:hypothetical protein
MGVQVRRTWRHCSMQNSYQIDVQEYERLAKPPRLAVGDVIRCPAFRSGMVIPGASASQEAVHVAWTSRIHFDSYLLHNSGIDATDETRGSAPFLVTSVMLEECEGPSDIGAPARLSRIVRAVRLTEGGRLQRDAERILFWLDEPMALARPDFEQIDVLGYARLPVGWETSAASP